MEEPIALAVRAIALEGRHPLGEAVAAWTRRFSAVHPANAGGGGSPR